MLGSLDWGEIVREAPDYILLVDRDSRILYINKVGQDTTLEEAVNSSAIDYMAEEFREGFRGKLERVFSQGIEEKFETRRNDPCASAQWWSIAMGPIRSDGEVRAAIMICRDVSDLQNIRIEQQRELSKIEEKFWNELSAHDRAKEMLIEEIGVRQTTEAALRESEARYRSLVENARNAIFSVDSDGCFNFMNPMAARQLGGKPEDYVGKQMTDFFPADVAARQIETIHRVITNRQGEMRQALTYLQGKFKWYITSVQPIVRDDGSCTAALLESTDVDEQVRSAQQLQRERNFSNSILQTANSLIVCLDSHARITVFNGECETVTGYKFEEVVGKSWPEIFLAPEARHDGLERFEDWVRTHPHDRYEGQIITKSGETRTIFWSNSSFTFEDTGELIAIAIGRDITELKLLEQSLKATEARNRAILECLPDMVFVVGSDGYFREFTGGYRQKLLLPEDKIVGAHLSTALPPDICDKSLKLIAKAICSGEVQALEYRLDGQDGVDVFEARFQRCQADECIVIVRDVTTRHRIERELADTNEQLQREHQNLTERNIALRVVLSQIGDKVEAVKVQMHTNIESLVMPQLERLRKNVPKSAWSRIEEIESQLQEISSPFASDLHKKTAQLTPREVEICNMIRKDMQSKEIAEQLHLSIRTVEKFRQRIRGKLGLNNEDINLATYLKSL